MKKVFLSLFITTLLSFLAQAKEVSNMEIQLSFGKYIIIAQLENNATSKSFADQLPIKVKPKDYASNEKIFNPPKALSVEGAPRGYDPSLGDITYYAPWGNIAIFYKDFSYSSGLISLGKITSGIEHLKKMDGVEVLIEKKK